MSSLRVVVADDQELVRTGFRMILEANGVNVVGAAEDGYVAVRLVEELAPDVVIMDVRMPRMDGIEATRRITSGGLDSKVLIVTTFDLDEYVYEALRAGASGFLLKDAPPDKLLEAIRVVAGGEALLSPSITRRLIDEFALRPTSDHKPDTLDELTDREVDVLKLVARGMSNQEIADALVVGETTVKTHVGHLLMKLGLRDRVQAVVVAYETGLVQPSGPGT